MSSPFRIEYFPDAQNDLEEIVTYIVKDNKDAAIHILEEFEKSILLLKQNPQIGIAPKFEKLKKLGLRLLNVKEYFVYYVIKSNRIEIRKIIYGWNNWSPKNKQGVLISHKDMMKRLRKIIDFSK